MSRLFLIRKANMYYSDIIDGKHYIYGFTNNRTALKCIEFIQYYKKRHNRFPCTERTYALKYVKNMETEPLYIEKSLTDDIVFDCLVNGLHVMSISEFDYTKDFNEEVSLTGQDLTSEMTVPEYEVVKNLDYIFSL